MPIADAICWLSATARIARPMRVYRNNQEKMPKNTRLTTRSDDSIGGSMIGPTNNGYLLHRHLQRARAGTEQQHATPREQGSHADRGLMTAMIGRPSNGRSTTRSSPKQKATIATNRHTAASQNGITVAAAAATKPPVMTNSPWAKLNASVAL